jgi:threonine aldolase
MARSKAASDVYLAGAAVAELEGTVAKLFAKEDAVFFPTGTMANNIAVRVLCGEKSRAIVQHESHLYADESDATQRLANINLLPLAPGRATPTLDEVSAAIDEAEKGRFPLGIGAISIESPVRRVGGELVPAADLAAIAALAKAHGIGLHLDAARLLLAPPNLDIPRYVAPFDTVYLSLYKYLGAPFGAVLAGGRGQMAKARELRHVYGGMINQGWIPAVMASDTLNGFSARIGRAHASAEQLVAALEASGKVRRRPNPNASNIHQLEMSQSLADMAFERGRAAGVHMARWKDGAMPFYINETITRRPLAEYRKLFLS